MASYTYELIELGDEHRLGCKCCRFGHGVDLPIPKKLSTDEVQKIARTFSQSIFTDWTKLNAILKRFEGTIQKRWLKKSPKQRKDILLSAWPDMPRGHRADFAGYRKSQHNTPRSRTLPSAAYLWPYINLEDLEQRNLLLMFLNSRGRCLPDKFVSADIEAAHLGKGWGGTLDKETHVMLLRGKHSPLSYGKVISFNKLRSSKPEDLTYQEVLEVITGPEMKVDDTLDKKGNGARYHLNVGLLALEIQQGIYSFLVSCTKLILHDISPSQYYLAPHQLRPQMPCGASNEWPSLAAHLMEAPYRLPQTMDLDRLKTLVDARRSAAEDHIWMLQEDPAYFISTLKEWKEHDIETSKTSCTHCWQHVAGRMLGSAFSYLLLWDRIYSMLDVMPPLEEQIETANHKTGRLSFAYEWAWCHLSLIIDLMIFHPINHIFIGVPAAPRMRHCFEWSKSGITDGSPWANEGIPHTEAERRVNILFHAITRDDLRQLHSLNHLVQEVQYMLDTDNEASPLVDSWLLSHFSDLAMLSELRLRIEGLEPWSQGWKRSVVLKSKAVGETTTSLLNFDDKLHTALHEACKASQILGDPTAESWEYPANKARTEKNVEQMRLVEMRLDLFWDEIDELVHENSEICIFTGIAKCTHEPRKLQRTEEWMPPLVQQPKTLSTPLKEKDVNTGCFHQGSSATSTPNPRTPTLCKTKVKTRGTPTTAHTRYSCSIDTTPSPDSANESPTTKVKVPKRTHKVLSALFPSANAESHQRVEIAWPEFCQAMDSIGLQPEKLYGSVWIFKPKMGVKTLVEVQRSIQFHQPKEVRKGSKIPASMVRTFGRRMKHAFGWVDGMFVNE